MKNITHVRFKEILDLIRNARHTALKAVNTKLIDLYWAVGEYVSNKAVSDNWGKGVVTELSKYIQENEHGIKGFSPQNIWRMKQFYDSYNQLPNLSALLREITWSSNLQILSKTKSIEEKEYYIRLSLDENLTVRELEREIDSGNFERTLLTGQKLSTTLRELHPNSNSYFKDIYVLDFLNLPDNFSELQLKKSIINNLKKFILEIGKDFTFIGEEYQLQVGNQDFYIDLLFYHRELCCLVAIELKIDDFKPEYLGKLNFYLEALDRNLKKSHEKPSVGMLLCKSKDSEVVEFALSRTMSPTLIAEYETKLIDKKLLRAKLIELYALDLKGFENS